MVERESKVKTKANTKKKLLIAAGVVVVALAAALIFISNYLGFSSQSHFCKVFKDIKGVTPDQYRKKKLI